MQLKLIETTISEGFVRMRYGDNLDPNAASQWLDFRVPSGALLNPAGQDALGDLEDRHLVTIQIAALRHVRSAIDEERKRLSNLAKRTA